MHMHTHKHLHTQNPIKKKVGSLLHISGIQHNVYTCMCMYTINITANKVTSGFALYSLDNLIGTWSNGIKEKHQFLWVYKRMRGSDMAA